jgi:hypothetical protein
MAVMGGLALATWKHPRSTQDVDLLLALSEGEVQPVLDLLVRAGLRPKKALQPISIGQLDVVQFLYEPPESFIDVQIDLLLAKTEYHRQALGRCVVVQLPDLAMDVAVLACEDLILHKLLAGRIIDRADVVSLLKANQPILEIEYLLRWARQLGLMPDLTQLWNEALPGRRLGE